MEDIKLTKISQTVNENARREAEVIIEEAKRIKSETLEAERIKLEKEIKEYIIEEGVKIQNEARNAVVRESLENKKVLLAVRNEYIQKIFEKVYEKVSNFTDSGEYVSYLEAGLAKVKEMFGGDFNLIIRCEDKDIFAKIAHGYDITVSKEIKTGGFIAESGRRILDLTLDTKLRDELARFTSKDAFIIDR